MKNVYFTICLSLLLVALGLNISARDQSIQSTSIRAHLWQHTEDEKTQLRIDAARCNARARILFWVGSGAMLFGFALMVVSNRRKELVGWYWLPMLLLLIDFLVQLLL